MPEAENAMTDGVENAPERGRVVERSREDLERAVEEANQLADERWDLYLRARADLENERKRWGRELENASLGARVELLRAVLPVKDSLELALAAAGATDAASFAEGMMLTLRSFESALASQGVEEVGRPGEPFDPNVHEALAVESSAGYLPGAVVQVHRKGYSLGGRLVRPAQVTVAKEQLS